MEIRTLTRAAQILASVNAEPTGITLSRIVDDVALSKATTYRFLKALVGMEFLRLDSQTGEYHIGPALLRFGRIAFQHEELRLLARPFLKELSASTGESATLVVVSGPQRLTLDAVLSEQELRAVPEIGALKPIYAGAAGKAILAWYPQAEFRSLFTKLPLKSVTARTMTSIAALEREFPRIREQGFATSVGETVFGQAASAAPLFGEGGKVIGSLNISGPSIRLPAAKLRLHGELARLAAAKLSKKYGSSKASRSKVRQRTNR